MISTPEAVSLSVIEFPTPPRSFASSLAFRFYTHLNCLEKIASLTLKQRFFNSAGCCRCRPVWHTVNDSREPIIIEKFYQCGSKCCCVFVSFAEAAMLYKWCFIVGTL